MFVCRCRRGTLVSHAVKPVVSSYVIGRLSAVGDDRAFDRTDAHSRGGIGGDLPLDCNVKRVESEADSANGGVNSEGIAGGLCRGYAVDAGFLTDRYFFLGPAR